MNSLSNQQTYLNTRRWRRHKLSVPIRVILSQPGKTTLTDGRGNELSEGGLALTAGVELKVGDQIMVEFTPPYSSCPIRVAGIVRNREGYRYGVEFLREGPEATAQVDRLCLMFNMMAEAE